MAFSPLSLRTIAFLLSLVIVLEFSSSIVQVTDVVEAGYHQTGGPAGYIPNVGACDKPCKAKCSEHPSEYCLYNCLACCSKFHCVKCPQCP
ncbi:hypothetical protein Scep_000715 [Stephania cephalantha]|uniref:Uncharacterized protein n=1 Tax=Stephania cephalantha TaxID=152367 RepID=A0AAP0LAQ8_9MAGN